MKSSHTKFTTGTKAFFKPLFLGALCGLCVSASACSHLTVAPVPVHAHAIRFDQNTQNAGVIDCDANGCIVTPGWLGRYRALEKDFNHAIAADDQIAVEGQNYRVSYEVSNNFAEMQASKRGGP